MIGLLAAGALIPATAPIASASTASSARCLRIAIPAYFDFSAAGGASVEPLVEAAPELAFAVLNPASGPGDAADPGYKTATGALLDAGVGVAGYVDTAYGARPAADVLADVRRWRQWYGVRNVFFDQVPTKKQQIGPYRRFVGAVQEAGGRAVINPGTYPAKAYVELADVTVTFEGDATAYQHAHQPPPWAREVARSRMWHLVYGVAPGQAAETVESARERRAGYVYATDDVLPDPWNQVPTDWSAELAAAAPPVGASCRSLQWGSGDGD